jgi:peptidyl-prolyl cis-trans isomerase A (cyclophilin A)
MSRGALRRYGWLVLFIAGCNNMLPPPPPPKTRTAPPLADTTPPPAKKGEDVPRGPDSAPDQFRVRFETSKGDFVVQVHRDWSPRGADQFHKLLKAGYYDGCKFFRVVPGFMAQFGINGDPKMNEKYLQQTIPDDQPRGISNTRGRITFAKTSAPNSRSAQVFINFGSNSHLDSDGFTPFGEVVEGMKDVVDELNGEYGEATTELQGTIAQAGNAFLDDRFPNLDYIIKARILDEKGEPLPLEGDKPDAGQPSEPQTPAAQENQ